MEEVLSVADALIEISGSDLEAACAAARAAMSENPGGLLASVLLEYLESVSSSGAYEEPSAFDEFISFGGNPNLYGETIARLAALHAEMRPETVLDIGCGDGRVTAGTVQTDSHVHLLEPSSELLKAAERTFTILPNGATSHEMGITELLDRTDLTTRWDLVQSTFAMHTITPQDRVDVLRRLRRRTERFVFVEFDVPAFDDRSQEHAVYAAERYEFGLGEYVGHPNVVTHFLMPVLVGQFDPNKQRHTFEQPAEAWCDQLSASGWSEVTTMPVADYWWAPAVMIEAKP